MSEYRILLAEMPSARAAKSAAGVLAETFAAHVMYVRRSKTYRAGITAPLADLARAEGFAWSDDDTFAADGDEPPDVGSLDRVLVVYHAACSDLGQHGITAFARKRGAKAVALWDPDPIAMTLELKLKTQAAQRGFDTWLSALCEECEAEIELVDDDPGDAAARLVVTAGSRSRYAKLTSSWGIGGVLVGLGAHAGLAATLTAVERVAPLWDPTFDPQVTGQTHGIVAAIRRAKLDEALADEAIAIASKLTEGRVDRATIESGLEVTELPREVAARVAEQTDLSWQLAAASPLTQRELAMTATAHGIWAKSAPGPHRWRRLAGVGGIPLVVYLGTTVRQASFARRDARGLSFKDRALPGANFSGALLDGADFTQADLRGASLHHVSARGTRFSGANLTGADLSAADLRDADWTGAVLDAADLTAAVR